MRARSTTATAVSDLLGRRAGTTAPNSGGHVNHWDAFVSGGFPWAAVGEDRGGPGGSVYDAVDIVREIGRAGVAVPAGETDLLGEWLLRQGNLPAVAELLVVAPGTASDDLRLQHDGGRVILTGTAKGVGWASQSGRFVALLGGPSVSHVVCVPCQRLKITTGQSLAGEPRGNVTAEGVTLGAHEIAEVPGLDVTALRARGAAIRTLLIQGAVDAVIDLASSYCATRTQFGRPLRDFQVVAHQLAMMHEQVTLVNSAAELATATLDGSGSWEDAATAKIVAGEVATAVAKAAHQLHGAIGISEEYALHRYTRRLWAWRDEYGGESEWSAKLGAVLVDRGSEAMWIWMSQSSDEVV